jgi:hypothetical protein
MFKFTFLNFCVFFQHLNQDLVGQMNMVNTAPDTQPWYNLLCVATGNLH